MIQVLFHVLLILFVYATGWFFISVYARRNDVADIAWGLGYCLICVYLFFTQPRNIASDVLYLLVMLWGLRLSLHIYFRSKKRPEDFRYRQWRETWGKTFYWRSYLQVYLLQAFLLFIIISPVLLVSVSEPVLWTWIPSVGVCIWIFGFVYQAVADHQLASFIRHKKDNSEILQTGLWKYSRHPNYFGEILMWWGIYIVVVPFKFSWMVIISPLTITCLLAFVSGVPMLEKRYAGNKKFEMYKKTTPALIPKWW